MNSTTGSGEHPGEQVREAGIETRAHEGRPAVARCGVEPFSQPVAEVRPGQIPVRRGDDVRTASQKCLHDLYVELCGHERHAVWALREQHGDVIRRTDSGVRRPGEPPGIDADLVRRVNVHAHELQLWVIDDGGERSPTDLASRPLHDPIRAHFPPLARARH